MKGITRDHFEITYLEGKDEKSEIVHTFPACCERYISLAREGKNPSVYLTTNHLIHHPKPHD